MKRILSFLLFLAFMMPWSAKAQQALPYSYGFEDNDLTVDGWTTANTSGLNAAKFGIDASAVKTGTYGFRFSSYDDNGVNTQCLISPELVAPNGLVAQFYYKSSSSYGAETFKVGYSTTTTDLESFTWSDEISATGGSWTQSEEFTCPAGTKYVALYYYSNYQYYLYVDDVTFSAPPTCIKPATLEATPASTTSATITWAAGNGETAFDYVYALAGEEADWTSPVTVNALTATITGLDQDADYVFYVRANCGEGDLSAISNVAFHAMRYCTPAPTSVDGSGITAVALGGVEQTEAVHKTNATKPLYADNSTMSFNVPASTVATVDITLATGYNYGTVIWVDWNNNMEFEADEVVYAAQSGSANPTTLNCTFTVPATQAEGTYRMRIGSADSYFDSYISSPTTNTANPCGTGTYCTYEDYSITVTAAPSCMQPATPVVSNITTTGADLAWTTEGTQTQFQYVVMASGTEADWTGATLVTSMTATLSGLTANTAYDVYVRAYCGETEQSDAVMVSFRTACDVITTFPWSENFDEVAVGNIEIPCWNNEHIAGSGAKLFAVATNSSSGNATKMGQLPDMSSGTITHLTLPAMNIPAANAYEFIITVYRDASGTSYPEEGLRLWSLVGADTVELAFISRNYTQAYTVDETVIVPAEEATGWYTYNFTLPLAGVQNIVVRGESKYGSATYFDNLVVRQIPNCTKIASLVASDPTADGITLTWVAGNNETQFQYVVMPKDTAVDWTGATIVTGLTATVSNLTDNTPYDAYVRAYCSEEEQGDYRMVSFRTLCGVAPLPYADGFENGIDCWTVGNMQSTSSSYIPSAYSGESYSHNGTYCLRLNAYVYTSASYPTNADSAYAVLPVMNFGAEGISAHRLRFYARQNSTTASYNNHLYVGTLTDPADMSTFTLVQDVVVEGTTYQQYEVSFANYTGEGQYIVLLATINPESTASSRYGSFYVDDLMVDLIPNCLRPTDVTVSNITANGAEITCVAGASETAWAVRYKAAADEDWTVATTSATMPYALTNLAANTAYQVEVAAVCSETETSEWTEPVNFRTACDVEAIPYTENFENGIYCWTVGNMQSESSSYIPSAYSGATYAHDGTYSLRLNAYKTSSTNADSAYAIMPAMNYGVKGLSGHTLKFYARQSSTSTYYSYYNQLMIGVVSDPADMSTFTLVRAEEVTGATYTFHEVQLGSYAGEGQYIVLLAVTDPTATGTRYGSFYVDDLSVEPTPACQPLASIAAVPARTKVEVTLNPKAGLELSAAYDLVCSATELDNEALEAAQKTVVTESPYTVTGLERETPYYIYVRANCGQEDGVSPWVSTTVTTKNVGPDCSASVPQILRTGDGTTKIDYVLWGSYYNRTYSQQIYTAEELTAAGLTPGYISKVAYQYAHTSAYTKTVTLYMGLTELSAFANTSFLTLPVVSEATPIEFATQGEWYEIELSVPLYWDGTSNVVVGAMSRGTNYSPNNTTQFYGGTTTENRAIFSRADNNDPSMETGTLTTNRADVRFTICPIGSPCPAVTNMTVALEGDGTTAARINWTTADADYLSSYDVLLSTTEVTDFTEVTPTATIADPTATTYVFSNLTAETHYYMYLRANCQAAGHNEGMSDWVGVDTIMNSACAAPNTLTTEFIGLNAVKASWHLAYAEQDMAFRYILSTDELDAAGIAAATPVNVDSNVIEIENLNYDQLYYLYVASACGNSTSEYISTSFTTYAACAPVENLTAARVEHNRVQLTWTKNAFGTETAYEVGIVGQETNAQIVAGTSATLIALEADSAYTAYVKAVCSETSESVIATVPFRTKAMPTGGCNTIGTGTSTAYLVYTSYGNTYSQHIYTAEELTALGYTAGVITSISFDYSGTSSTYDKTQSVYMGLTDKSSFTGSTANDFISNLTLVYEPTLLTYQSGWRSYDLTTPFEWDGESNIVIGMLTNSTASSASGWSTRGTTTTGVYRTIYRYKDNTEIDIDNLAATTYSGSRSTTRPNLQICFAEMGTCPDVTRLAISDVTTTTATATWEPMGMETAWNVYLSTVEIANPSTIVGTQVNSMTYAMANLRVDQDYWFYVQPVCTGANSWKVVTFRTVATCFPPTALAVDSIEARTATVSWTDANEVGNYTVAYGIAADFNISDAATYAVTNVTTLNAVLTDLVPETRYAFAVKSNCGVNEESRYSAPAYFTTEISCFAPTNLVASNARANSVVISWTDTHDAVAYTVYYGDAATFSIDDEIYMTADAETKEIVLTGLEANSSYKVAVKSVCGPNDESAISSVLTFNTARTLPYVPVFGTALPTEMIKRSGLMNADTVYTSTLGSYSSPEWVIKTSDAAISGAHMKLNIYGTNCKAWITTPVFDLSMLSAEDNIVLEFDLALCDYNDPGVATEQTGSDDKFAVIISEDGGVSWMKSNMTLWQDNAEDADYSFAGIPTTAQHITINMSQYAGKSICVAFYGESTITSNGDNDLHVGNIRLMKVVNYTEAICQYRMIDNHGFDAATTDSAGVFHFEEMRAAEFGLVTFDLTVYEYLNNEVIIDTAYVGDHYVDRFYDFYVQEGDEEAYGFEEVNIHGCDSVWLVTFYNILTAETILENHELADGETYIWHEMSITEPGLYYDTVRSEMGGVKAYYELTVTAAAPAPQGKTFELVTTQLADWTGNYLIVFADNKAHATFGISGTGSNPKDLIATSDELTISEDNKITTADSCFVTVESMGIDGYSILMPAGTYFAQVTSNAFAVSNTPVAMTFNYTENGVEIASANGRILYQQVNNGNTYYRMYNPQSASNYSLPQLYKEVSGDGPATKVETINAEDGAVKVILNGSLYIIRDNQWYDATGRLTVDPRK